MKNINKQDNENCQLDLPVSWRIKYDNYGNGGFEEWWNVINVKNDDKYFKCYNEENANWLCDLLNKIAS